MQAVSEKVPTCQAVPLVEVVVSLNDEIVVAVLIWQSDVELGVIDAVRVGICIGGIKRRKVKAQCVHAAGHSTRGASRRHAGLRIGNAIERVPAGQTAGYRRSTASCERVYHLRP